MPQKKTRQNREIKLILKRRKQSLAKISDHVSERCEKGRKLKGRKRRRK